MRFDTIGAEWFQAVNVNTEIGDFLSGVFQTLQTTSVSTFHSIILNLTNQWTL